MRESSRWTEVTEHVPEASASIGSFVDGPAGDTLSVVKHRRLAAASAVALVLSGQIMNSAAADPVVPRLLPTDCLAYKATPQGTDLRAWHLERLQMTAVWDIATGKEVTVAVIDTGVSTVGTTYYPDDRIESWNFAGEKTPEEADAGGMDCAHGTAVASLIAAGRRPTGGGGARTDFAGIAPDAEIIGYRVLTASEPIKGQKDTLEPTVNAIRDAIAKDVDIINLSQSAAIDNPLLDSLESAIDDALAAGIVVVAAAGNTKEGAPDPSFPGYFPQVISVGATTSTDAASFISLPGDHVTLGAPGEGLMGLWPSTNTTEVTAANQAYADYLVGTSFAAPIVSGVVALMLENDPTMTPLEVKERLVETADPPPAAVPDARLGYGIVNPLRALTAVTASREKNPEADEVVPPKPMPDVEQPDMGPSMIAVSVGAGALAVTAIGLVAAIAIPRAARRS